MKVCSRLMSKGQGHQRSKYDVIWCVSKIQTFVKLKDYKKFKMIVLFICRYIQLQYNIWQF